MAARRSTTKQIAIPASRKERLALFKAKRVEWVKILHGMHPNSVSNQLWQAARDAAFFRTIEEIGRKSEAQGHHVNAEMLRFFMFGYAHRQSLVIRRLVDPRDDVRSLRRVVDDLKAHRGLLTREAIVGHDGTPFDSAAAHEVYINSIDWTSRDKAGDPILLRRWMDSDLRNIAFDRISEKGNAGRGDADDLVREKVLERLIDEMAAPPIKRIKRMVNKFLAHADEEADPRDPDQAPTNRDIDASIQALAQIQAFLLAHVLNETSAGLVPVPQYDLFEHISQPFVPESEATSAYGIWHRHKQEIEQWTHDSNAMARFFG